ncbi:MAG: hypothetical protein L3J43_06185 [Sulfurovum sp.]|nr:hypothetical protein [Sulfurovum sp.]
MIEGFQQTQSSHTLLVATKGLDNKALEKIKKIEEELDALDFVAIKKSHLNRDLIRHQKEYKLLIQEVNLTKLSTLEVPLELKKLYDEMTSSFFPVIIDKIDPFQVLNPPNPIEIKTKNGHLTLGNYGYLSYFTLGSQNLNEHQKMYRDIYKVMKDKKEIQFFSPLFYYVENSQAIRADVQTIIYISFAILLVLYFIILKDILLLIHTLITLATSTILAMVILTQMYEEVSIFVFIFGISISTVAIDYMFHHYLHGYYHEKKKLNTEVFFGFLTTFCAFFILSFTSFMLIKQIAFFTMVTLSISYLHFSFLYPKIGFKEFTLNKMKDKKENTFFCKLSPRIFLLFSLILIFLSSLWIEFDFNLKNLDYDNKRLKKTEHFFKSHDTLHQNVPFVVKAKSIDTLIQHSKTIKQKVPTAHLPLSGQMSQVSYAKNKEIFTHHQSLRERLLIESRQLGFKEAYFDKAYDVQKPLIMYTAQVIRNYGIEVVKIDDYYITFGTISKKDYTQVLQYDFIHSLSIKEHFEVLMQEYVQNIGVLGFLVIMMILVIFFIISGKNFIYAMVFLVFPISMMGVYAFFSSINILHLFMLFIILAISIDYAIYMSRDNNERTKKAIHFSLISTFAGFGVLVFSQINALFSLGIIAIIGIGAISILLVCMKDKYVS